MADVKLASGTLIVLEGLDKTGKTTQSDALRRLLDPATTSHVHMPSGATAFTKGIYDLLESADRSPSNGVAKQLAHLACHAEAVPRVQHLLTTGSVVLDRWWWSTFAYGWCTGDIPAAGITDSVVRNLVDSIWSRVNASVVFLFDEPYEEDSNNAGPVLAGYQQLAASFADTVRVPQGDPAHITNMLLSELQRRDLIVF